MRDRAVVVAEAVAVGMSVRVLAGMSVVMVMVVVVVVVMIRRGRMIVPGMVLRAVLHIQWFAPLCGRLCGDIGLGAA